MIGSRALGDHEPGALLPQARAGNLVACLLIRLLYRHRYTDLGPVPRHPLGPASRQLRMSDPDFGWTAEMQVKALRHGLAVREVPVSYRKRIGVSKVTGTLYGTVMAGYKILWTVLRYSVRRHDKDRLRSAGSSHTVDVEVRYAETDQMGVVHHANYLVWFELARTGLCAQTGYDYPEIERAGYLHPGHRRRAALPARRALRRPRPGPGAGSSALESRGLRFSYEVRRDGERLASGRTSHLWVEAASGRVCRIPSPWREAFAACCRADTLTRPMRRLQLLTGGESHGPGLTALLTGMPAGLAVDLELSAPRHAPAHARLRPRRPHEDREPTRWRSAAACAAARPSARPSPCGSRTATSPTGSGVMDPLEIDAAKAELRRLKSPRPGHADLAGGLKYLRRDLRDVLERASARESAARVAAGAFAKMLLAELGIEIRSGVRSLGPIGADAPTPTWEEMLARRRHLAAARPRPRPRGRDGGPGRPDRRRRRHARRRGHRHRPQRAARAWAPTRSGTRSSTAGWRGR